MRQTIIIACSTILLTTACFGANKTPPVFPDQDSIDNQPGYICITANPEKKGFEEVSSEVPHRVFVFSPKHRTFAAYKNGRRVRTGRASGGAHWCADVGRSCRTPVGRFRINSMGSAGCRSSKYPRPNGGAKMPHCMFFHGGYAIHGSHDVPTHRNASHGCIRVQPKDAKWLRHNFMTIGTSVVVRPYK